MNGVLADLVLDATTGELSQLLEGEDIQKASPSPDGNYFALIQSDGKKNAANTVISNISLRGLSNPVVGVGPVFEQGTPGADYSAIAALEGWSADGTYLTVDTRGGNIKDSSLLSVVAGKAVQKVSQNDFSAAYGTYRPVVALFTLELIETYHGQDQPVDLAIAIKNIDGSEQNTLFAVQALLQNPYYDLPIRVAQVPRV